MAAAFSGGNDSLAMALLLKELSAEMGFSLVLFHVNHHIRGAAADADAAWAEEFGRQMDIPVRVFDVEPLAYAKEHTGVSVEEAARILRYRAMAEGVAELETQKDASEKGRRPAPGADFQSHVVLAVAHHLEDEAETVLFRLARGTGPAGIDALKPVTVLKNFQGITLIRPVLPLTRAELESVVEESPYAAREDATNEDDDIARNRIRHRVLPELSAVNSGAAAHIAAFAEKTGALYGFLEEETRRVPGLFEREEGGGASLVRAALNRLPAVQKECAVRLWLQENAIPMRDIGEAQIEAVIESAAADKGPGKRTDLSGGYWAVTDYTYVFLQKRETSADYETRNAYQASGTQNQPGPGELLRIPLSALTPEKALTCDIPGGTISFTLLTGESAQAIVSQEIPQKNYTKYFDYDTINSDFLCLRTRCGGDRIAFSAGQVKPLRRYFIDEKIPAGERDSCLLLADGSDILWVIGHRIGADYRVCGRTERVLAVSCAGALY